MLRKLNQTLFKPKILIFSLIIFANSILAMPAQELFLQANQLYLSQDYVGALAAYEKLEHKAGIVWHNMGNCYFYQNNLVFAIWAWVNACKLGNKTCIKGSLNNIVRAQKLLELDLVASYRPMGVFKFLTGFISWFAWQAMLLTLLFLLFFILIKRLFGRKLILFLIILVETAILGMSYLYVQENNLSYAVVQNNAMLLAGPAEDYHILNQALKGQVFKVEQCEKDWCWVKGRQVQGWLAKKDLLIV